MFSRIWERNNRSHKMTNLNWSMNFAYHIEELFIINCQFMGHMSQMILKCKEKTSLNLWIIRLSLIKILIFIFKEYKHMCTLHYLNVWYAHRTYLDLDILSLLLLFSPVPFFVLAGPTKKMVLSWMAKYHFFFINQLLRKYFILLTQTVTENNSCNCM